MKEVVAKKVRALLQFSKKLHERGWSRSCVRDYYDIWSFLTEYSFNIDNIEISVFYEFFRVFRYKVRGNNFLSVVSISRVNLK